jgi:fructose-specific phosphotransferase system IIC component
METWAREAGFIKIVRKTFNVPYGAWPKDKKLKDIGRFVSHFMELMLDGFVAYPIGEILGWSFAEVQVLVAQMRSAVLNLTNLANGDM